MSNKVFGVWFVITSCLLILFINPSVSKADLILPGWEKYYDEYQTAKCPAGKAMVECNILDESSQTGCDKYLNNSRYTELASIKYSMKFCYYSSWRGIIKQLLVAICLTVVTELTIWMIVGVESGIQLLGITVVNIITVTLANLGLIAVNFGTYGRGVLIEEMLVIIVELGALWLILRKTFTNRKIIVITILANLASYVTGLILSPIF